ncbi:MAG: hypothetical protein IBX67_02095, partial [Dehalococcoidia bacterium]|nr:hypothetical protein [Dehalococcoidia bacterium]
SVTGDQYVGGLVGSNQESSVGSCYSVGYVTGTTDIGGLVGWNDATVTNSFWDTQTSGQAASAGGTGRTTAQMRNITTFTGAGWDIVLIGDYFNETWYIDNGNDYPRLGWQYP